MLNKILTRMMIRKMKQLKILKMLNCIMKFYKEKLKNLLRERERKKSIRIKIKLIKAQRMATCKIKKQIKIKFLKIKLKQAKIYLWYRKIRIEFKT